MSNHKPDDERRDSFLHIHCQQSEKTAWVRKANEAAKAKRQRDERGALAGWVRDTLNEKANHQPTKE